MIIDDKVACSMSSTEIRTVIPTCVVSAVIALLKGSPTGKIPSL